MKIRYTHKARTQLQEIYTFYKENNLEKHGLLIRKKLTEQINRLQDFPNLGPIEPKLESNELGHRYLVEKHYKIIYRTMPDAVLVIAIFDTRQDLTKLLED